MQSKMNSSLVSAIGSFYRGMVKPVLFQLDPEMVHAVTMSLSEAVGRNTVAKSVTSEVFNVNHSELSQNIAGIKFSNPVGLAAGFDYEAKLTQILPSLGFGFQTVGTITNSAYEGNPRPMLGRLPKSKSLMVNKGFKNLGAERTVHRLRGLKFAIPVGISIGRTNSTALKTQKQSVSDIIEAFTIFVKSKVPNSYYELNISCPNLMGNITFYPPKNLEELLTEVDKLHLKKPVFVKMPIDKTDRETLKMLEIIVKHTPAGVIFGNLQKNRNDPTLDPLEAAKFQKGNFSGKPTFARSNELIRLTYKAYNDKLVIIGCGGVFSADDAWQKVISGASLVQLITGLVYQGPQLVSEVNTGLSEKLKINGFRNIMEARGTGVS